MSNCDVCIGGFEGDTCEFFHESTPRARKPHKCSECDLTINPGEKYQRVTGKNDGEVWRYDSCVLCAEVRKVFTCGEGETLGGMLWEQMTECAFPSLTTASPCFAQLSPAAKKLVLDKWQKWKFRKL